MDSGSEPHLRLLSRKPQADLLPRQPELPAPVFAQPEVPVAPARSEDGPGEDTVHHNMVDGTTTLVGRINDALVFAQRWQEELRRVLG